MLTKIKPGILLLVLLLIQVIMLPAVQQNKTPAPGNNRQALQSNLQKLEKTGINNADFYNQLGLSYYQQGKTGKAVICFLRALRLNSNLADSRNNLKYVINLTQDKEMYTQPSFLPSLFQNVFDFFSLNTIAWLVLILLIITVLCIHWLLNLPSGQDKAVPVMWLVIFSFVLLLMGTMLGLKYRGFIDSSKAVVMEPVVEGFAGPGPEYGKLFNVHEGLIVHISRVDNNWALVTMPNGGAGWMQSYYLERVKP